MSCVSVGKQSIVQHDVSALANEGLFRDVRTKFFEQNKSSVISQTRPYRRCIG